MMVQTADLAGEISSPRKVTQSKDDTCLETPKGRMALKYKMDPRLLLERKHSSGDLQSRLKTRKVLGVGEIDDGDVHRSKISQILGHSEHLYRKLPRGLWCWQIVEALIFTATSLLCLLFPGKLHDMVFTVQISPDSVASTRLYGVALLSFAVMWWNVVLNPMCATDRAVVKLCLLVATVFYISYSAALVVTLFQGSLEGWCRPMLAVVLRALFAFVSGSYYYAIDHPGFSPFWGLLNTTSHQRTQPIHKSPSTNEMQPCRTPTELSVDKQTADTLKKTE